MRIFLVILTLSLTACAVGNRYDYQSVRAPLPKTTKKVSVAVAAVDRREYLINEEVPASYVGMTRGGFGNPWRVATKSGAPLAVDLSESLVGSLNASGYQAKALSGYPVLDKAAATSKLLATPADRRILVTVNKWESDTLINTELTTDLTVQVFDQSGRLLASKSYTSTKGLGGNFLNPTIHARKGVLTETSKIIARIFSSPDISKALSL